MYKLLEKDREQLRKKLLKIIRYGHRGHGYHAGNQFAINSYWVRRKAFSQAKARELMGAKLYQRAFKTQKYVHLDAMEQQERLESTNQQLPKEPP